MTLRHKRFQNYKHAAFNYNQFLHYNFYQTVHCRRNISSSPLQKSPSGPGPPLYRCFMITLRHTTIGGTSLDRWSDRRRYLYVTTPNTHNRQTFMLPTEPERTIPVSERPHTYVLLRPCGHRNQHPQYCRQ
jgi:hypothetical protein